MANARTISVETLRQLLDYDPDTGILHWKQRPASFFASARAHSIWNKKYAGRQALTFEERGYRMGTVLYAPVKAHRVGWAIYYGKWPTGVIDHINGNPGDNRIVNLRDVSQADNAKNCKRRVTNTSGVTGVSWFARDGKWQVRIGTRHIGYFATLADAESARDIANKNQGYHQNHGRAS